MFNTLKHIEDKINKLIVPGNKVKIDYGKMEALTEVCHIRAIVDDVMVVYCVWMKHRKCWNYKVESKYYFELREKKLINQGRCESE